MQLEGARRPRELVQGHVGLLQLGVGAHAEHGAERGQRHLVSRVRIVHLDARASGSHPMRQDRPPRGRRRDEHVVALGNHLPPALRFGMFGIDLDQPPVGSVEIGHGQQAIAGEPGLDPLFGAIEGWHERSRPRTQENGGPQRAAVQREYRPAAVGRDRERGREVGLVAVAPEQVLVGLGVGAHQVPVDVAVVHLLSPGHGARERAARVEEGLGVGFERDRRPAAAVDAVGQRPPAGGLHQREHAVLAAGFGYADGDQLAVVRGIPPVDGAGAVRAERVGIGQHPFAPAFGDPQAGLVGARLPAQEEPVSAARPAGPEGADVHHLAQPGLDRRPLGQAVQIGSRVGLLRGNPCLDLRGGLVLQPAVGVVDLDPVHNLDHVFYPC